MKKAYVNPNLCRSPHDPEYNDDFDPQEEWEAYEQAQIEESERKMQEC